MYTLCTLAKSCLDDVNHLSNAASLIPSINVLSASSLSGIGAK